MGTKGKTAVLHGLRAAKGTADERGVHENVEGLRADFEATGKLPRHWRRYFEKWKRGGAR